MPPSRALHDLLAWNANKKFWLLALAFVLAIGAALLAAGLRWWDRLSPATRAALGEHPDGWLLPVAIAGLTAALLFGLVRLYQAYVQPLGRIAEEIALIQSANPGHRIKPCGSASIDRLIGLINDGADQQETQQREVGQQIQRAKARVESEKNTFAAFIAELPEGVVICKPDGSILLYNRLAQRFLAGGIGEGAAGGAFIGLGRSIFTVIDRHLLGHVLDEIAQKLGSGQPDCVSRFMLGGREQRQLRTEAVPIVDDDGKLSGFILIMYDITRQLHNDHRVTLLLKSMIKEIRSSLGGMRAAIETVTDFPDMAREQLAVFHQAMHADALALSATIERTATAYAEQAKSQWPMVHLPAGELLESLRAKSQAQLGLELEIGAAEAGREGWIEAEHYSLLQALLFVIGRLRQERDASGFAAKILRERGFAHLELRWRGAPTSVEQLKGWGELAVTGPSEPLPHSLKEVIEHHEAEITPCSPGAAGGGALRLILPEREAPSAAAIKQAVVMPSARPEFFDFDLFHQHGQNPELDSTPLAELAYTVFDTETTGLNPAGGDEIIQLGAVRIVNQRVLQGEMIDQLVDPQRSVPAASIAVHHIQPETLVGQPRIDSVLPHFQRFAGDTILIAHNAAFDMAMLKAKEKATGVVFGNPVLDTLLLSAVAQPEQDNHALDAIAARLGVSIHGRHSAFGDALSTAEVFLRLLPLLAKQGVHTLGQAREASEKTFYARLKY